MLKWKEEYSIGIKLIDVQHKHFFELGNSVYELLENDHCSDRYSKIFQAIEDLRQYAKFHFTCEEEYMLQINYQNYYNQKIEHDTFIKKIDSLSLDKTKVNQDKYISDLLLFIFDWITDHILYKDKLIEEEYMA